MSTLEQDLAHLNFEYLMLARECARNNLMEAAWRFGVDRKQIEEIAEFPWKISGSSPALPEP